MEEIRELAGRRIGGRGGVVRDADQPPVDGGSMKKYNTRPIDFTGCHPVIAEHLKRGEAIECRVWSDKGYTESNLVKFVVRYHAVSKYPYETYNNVYQHAEPIPLKVKRIMPPERAIPVLIAEGFAFTSKGDLSGPEITLTRRMYALMGEDIDGEARDFAWPACIIEEVEDDE